ncbi:MAG: DUF1573 domain-containing protein [Elusimicrobia bacterium]|nr:DUF1573 domain-containing protein [Candidatus Liberimonas magnetica]
MRYIKIFYLLILLPVCSYAQPKISLSKAYWEPGKINKGTILTETLAVRNSGTTDLEVSARSSCPCISITPSKSAIKPGQKYDFKISFDSREQSLGKKSEYIFIDTNDPANESVTWLIEGEVVEKIVTSDQLPVTRGQETDNRLQTSKQETEHIQNTGNKIPIEIYSTPGCSYCKKLKETIIPGISKKYGLEFKITEYMLNVKANYERLLFVENKLKKKGNKLPAIVVAGEIFGGEAEIETEFEKYLLTLKNNPGQAKQVLFMPDEKIVKQETAERIRSMKVLPIIAAALIDGVNPCAFAGILFLVAYLSLIQKKPFFEVFWTGMMFIFGIFVVYFLIGLGLAKVFVALSALKYVSKTLYIVMGCITLVLAYFSFQDYFSLKGAELGKEAKVTLQLPMWLKVRMHDFIQKYANVRYLIPFGFFLGVVISFMEFFCTGQIYLPTIMYMASIPELIAKAFFYLIIYSFVFILPLVFIFVTVLISSRSGRMQALGRKDVRLVKLLTGILFLVLSVLMFVFL